MLQQPGKLWRIAAIAALLTVNACITLRMTTQRSSDRGVRINHALHAEEGVDCSVCHGFGEGEARFPNHDTCSVCHDIPEELEPDESCQRCHTTEDFSITPFETNLPPDVTFDHAVHIEKELACSLCHPNPDQRLLPKKALKPFCMDCHQTVDPALNECSVCHSETRRDVRPASRRGVAIAHDLPDVWMRTHGLESQVDAAYCTYCHEQESYCSDCHRTTPPADHTVTWRRKTHGLKAAWNRQSCATCHEEDTCAKCHQNTAPSSHRRSAWGSPMNTHCVSCHYPTSDTSCSVCHKQIEHPSALSSPHALGVYPANCGQCHPGGLPLNSPHVRNDGVRCTVCHIG